MEHQGTERSTRRCRNVGLSYQVRESLIIREIGSPLTRYQTRRGYVAISIRYLDVLLRYFIAAGTELEFDNCPPGKQDIDSCMAAFLALHLTHGSSAYLEVIPNPQTICFILNLTVLGHLDMAR